MTVIYYNIQNYENIVIEISFVVEHQTIQLKLVLMIMRKSRYDPNSYSIDYTRCAVISHRYIQFIIHGILPYIIYGIFYHIIQIVMVQH